ncbi:hypothetical protein MMC16_000269, partial [Acarospora aff. strigata]|nr:hypothetical protein [Acarospora aff. strigata]
MLTKIMPDYIVVATNDACPPAGPYSQAIKTPHQIYVSGQIPADKTGSLVEGSISDKTRQCIENIIAILSEAQSSIKKVVKVTVFLTDMDNFAEMNS